MNGAYAGSTSRIRRPRGIDVPHVLIAAANTVSWFTIAQALRDAGYFVSTTLTGTDLLRELRTQRAIELLVIDGSEEHWMVESIIESVRTINWALPIVLISRPDPRLRAEAERQGVEAILETPVALSDKPSSGPEFTYVPSPAVAMPVSAPSALGFRGRP